MLELSGVEVEDVSFQFGFRTLAPSTSPATSENNKADLCSTLPTLTESGLGVVEYQQVATAVNKELAAPPAKQSCGSGIYTPIQRAMIGSTHLKMVMKEARSISCLNSLIYQRAL